MDAFGEEEGDSKEGEKAASEGGDILARQFPLFNVEATALPRGGLWPFLWPVEEPPCATCTFSRQLAPVPEREVTGVTVTSVHTTEWWTEDRPFLSGR